MDGANLSIQIQENRAEYTLRIHKLAVEKLTSAKSITAGELFDKTLGLAQPILNNETCEWRIPELKATTEAQSDYYTLYVVSVCNLFRVNTKSLEIELHFIKSQNEAFSLFTQISGLDSDSKENLQLILNTKNTAIKINSEEFKKQSLFVKLGMAHIGADLEEWKSPEGGLQWPEGLDHIFFVIALVLTGTTLFSIIKNVTGFTIGHTLTLVLSTYQIIHVHTHWVEALIAFTICLVLALYYFKPDFKHGLLINTVLGTVHGLGFASVIHDLQLPQEMVLPTLLSFNVGVELGQVIIILITYGLFALVKKFLPKQYTHFIKSISLVIFVLSSYWFLTRAIV